MLSKEALKKENIQRLHAMDKHYINAKNAILKRQQHIKDGKVLVHCAMGISRSGGLIVAWILKENPAWGWNDAMDYINKSRLVFPAVEIRESILDYFESIEGKRRVF